MKVDATVKDTRVAIAVNTPGLSLRPFVIPGLDLGEKTARAVSENAGPLDVSLVLRVAAGGTIGIDDLRLTAGRPDLLAFSLQGAVGNVQELTGIEIQLAAEGLNAADLEQLFGQPVSLQGPYTLRTAVTDPADGTYRFDPLSFSLDDDQASGFAEINVSEKPMRVTADLSAADFDLSQLLPAAADRVKPDAQKLGEVMDRQNVMPEWPVPPRLIRQLDAGIRLRANRVKAAALDIEGLFIKLGSPGDELTLSAEARKVSYNKGSDEAYDQFQMGGVNFSLLGRAAGSRMVPSRFAAETRTPCRFL